MSKPGSPQLLSSHTLLRIQAFSGLLFATFLILHLINTMLAIAGQTSYDTYQEAVRWYYQFPPVELVVVIGSASVHAWAGLIQILRRFRRMQKQGTTGIVLPVRIKMHRWCGYVMLLIIPGHVAGTRLPGLLEGLPADFSFVFFSIKHWPWFFYPYLLIYGVCASFHLIHGTLVAFGVFGLTMPRWAMEQKSKPFWGIFTIIALIIVWGVFSLGGNFFTPPTDRFPELKAYYEKKFQKTFTPWKEKP